MSASCSIDVCTATPSAPKFCVPTNLASADGEDVGRSVAELAVQRRRDAEAQEQPGGVVDEPPARRSELDGPRASVDVDGNAAGGSPQVPEEQPDLRLRQAEDLRRD